jgi:hypothetical protein
MVDALAVRPADTRFGTVFGTASVACALAVDGQGYSGCDCY